MNITPPFMAAANLICANASAGLEEGDYAKRDQPPKKCVIQSALRPKVTVSEPAYLDQVGGNPRDGVEDTKFSRQQNRDAHDQKQRFGERAQQRRQSVGLDRHEAKSFCVLGYRPLSGGVVR